MSSPWGKQEVAPVVLSNIMSEQIQESNILANETTTQVDDLALAQALALSLKESCQVQTPHVDAVDDYALALQLQEEEQGMLYYIYNHVLYRH